MNQTTENLAIDNSNNTVIIYVNLHDSIYEDKFDSVVIYCNNYNIFEDHKTDISQLFTIDDIVSFVNNIKNKLINKYNEASNNIYVMYHKPIDQDLSQKICSTMHSKCQSGSCSIV